MSIRKVVDWLSRNPPPPARTFAYEDWAVHATPLSKDIDLPGLEHVIRHGHPDLIWATSVLGRLVGLDARLVGDEMYEITEHEHRSTFVRAHVPRGAIDSSIVPGSEFSVDELVAAANRVLASPNDLVPFLAQQLGAHELRDVVDKLKYQIDHGTLEVAPAEFVQVPKPGWTTRPAAIMRLVDLIVAEALVSRLRPFLEVALPSSPTLLWPRAIPATTSPNMDDVVGSMGTEYICVADVADFFGSVDHSKLKHLLLLTAPMPKEIDMLMALLSKAMGARRGLPQGVGASDALATMYLTPVDRELVSLNAPHARRMDDFRIGASDLGDAREQIYRLQASVEKMDLRLNAAKTYPIPRARYLERSQDRKSALELHRMMLRERELGALLAAHPEEPYELMDAAGLSEEDKWDWYHQRMDLDELVERIRQAVEPRDAEAAAAMFREALDGGPARNGQLDRERFEWQVRDALATLIALGSPAVAEAIPAAMLDYPEETPALVTYLASLDESSSVAVEALDRLCNSSGVLDWQVAWLYRVLSTLADLDPAVEQQAARDVEDGSLSWIRRVESARVLAVFGKLTPALIEAIRNLPAALSPLVRSTIENQSPLTGSVAMAPLDEAVGDAVARSAANPRREV